MDSEFFRSKREQVWDAVRTQADDFTLLSIANQTKLTTSYIRDYVVGLEKAGFIEQCFKEPLPRKLVRVHYRLLKDVGNEAPTVTKDGRVLNPAKSNAAMWLTLRICGDVTPRTLAALASTEELEVKVSWAASYLQLLHKAGYVTVVKASNHTRQATYRLTKNTGAKPPQIQRTKCVFDPNLGQVMYQEQPEDLEVCDA